MEYISTKEASEKWGISTIRITILANEGRIPGAKRLGKSWLIPATANKPPVRKARRSRRTVDEPVDFSFPLYHFRSDFSNSMEGQLSETQKILFQAETAVLECRFEDAYQIVKPILSSPDHIVTEIGCLWTAGICCIALNNQKDFSGIYLRLQILFSQDFPHRDDLIIILDFLKTYVDTIEYVAKNYTYKPNRHDQSIPMACVVTGYVEAIREILKPKSANIPLLELNLSLLKNTGAIIALEYMHLYLTGAYFIRQDTESAQKHARAAVQIAFENKLYLPLVTFYRYNAETLSPIVKEYPEEFQDHCKKLASQYEENFTAFLLSIDENTIFSKLTAIDFPYTQCIVMGLSNAQISKKLKVHPQTVKNRLKSLYKKLGVHTKTELREYIISNL